MPSDKQADKFYKAVAKFLEQSGWSVAVVGGISIEHDPRDPNYKFRLLIGFAGKRMEATDGQ